MVADEVDFVVGVDTHLEEHVPAVVSRQRGLARRSVWENARGYSALVQGVDLAGFQDRLRAGSEDRQPDRRPAVGSSEFTVEDQDGT